MHLDRFVKTDSGKILMSIVLGIGLATLFRAACSGKRCRLVRAPPMDEMDGQTYQFGDKCYALHKQAVRCDARRGQTLPLG